MARHLGLDLGGTNVKAVVLDGSELVASATFPTDAPRGPRAVVDRLAEVARWATDHHGPVETLGLDPGAVRPDRRPCCSSPTCRDHGRVTRCARRWRRNWEDRSI